MAAGLASRTLFTCGFSGVACLLSSVHRFTTRSLQGSSSVVVTPLLQLRRGGSRDFRGFSSSRQPDYNNRRSVRAMATMPTNAPIEAAANNPGLCDTPDDATKTYFLQQTMYRIKDPKASLEFYSKVLGMTLLRRFDFPDAKFSLYFLGYEDPATIPTDGVERTAFLFNCKATLELTHNWGTEKDSNFKGYHNGNSDPRGYGHIGITVDDVYKACDRFEKLGVEFAKRPDDGVMKGLAFIKDPDGYWIEIFEVALITKAI